MAEEYDDGSTQDTVEDYFGDEAAESIERLVDARLAARETKQPEPESQQAGGVVGGLPGSADAPSARDAHDDKLLDAILDGKCGADCRESCSA